MRRTPCGCCATRDLPVAVPKICAPHLRRLQILTAATPFARCIRHHRRRSQTFPYPRTVTGASCLSSEHFCSLPACQKRLFDTLKGCRDFPCTLSLCALRRVTFPKSKNARFLRCKASCFLECPKLQKGMGAAHAAGCRSHAACRLCFAERRPEGERFAQPANWLL